MKVFMSWSGSRSKAVAELLAWWAKCVLQASRPWISTADVDRGSLWFSEITNNLSDTLVGIVCLTDENKERPWVLFEAGALAKGLSNSRVCTFLIDLEPKDIKDPLAQFNHTMPTPEDMKKLARTLNSALASGALEASVLSDVCDVYWPKFKERFDKALLENPPVEPKIERSDGDVLSEILDSVRGMTQRIRQLEVAPENLAPWLSWEGVLNDEVSMLTDQAIAVLRAAHPHGAPEDVVENLAKKFGLNTTNVRKLINGDNGKGISPAREAINAALAAARAASRVDSGKN